MGDGGGRWPPGRDRLDQLNTLPPKPVAIDRLRSGLSPRSTELDDAHVNALLEVVSVLPPILVHAGSMAVIDGLHRVEAARRSGATQIQAVLAPIDWAEAAVLAVVANVAHGKPLTVEERKQAAQRLLRSSPHHSDRSIAATCGLAPSTVAKVRAQCAELDPNPTGRIGVDGHRHSPCADEVKAKLADVLHDHPELSRRTVARQVGVSPSTVSRTARRSGPRLGGRALADGVRVSSRPSPEPARPDAALLSMPEADGFVAWFLSCRIERADWQQYILVVPLGRIYEIADECRRRADAWRDMATALERRTGSASKR